jgi:hypothetical protein
VIGEKGEYWRSLCEQAAKEQDSNKLLELVREINQLLQEKELRLEEAQRRSRESYLPSKLGSFT